MRAFIGNSLHSIGKPLADDDAYYRNKIAVITGASSGIGRAIAMELAIRGAKVVLASRNEKKLVELKAIIESQGGYASVFQVDVTHEEECKALVESTAETFGKIDILINNAGISMHANFSEVDMDVLHRVMDTNFWGSVYCSRYALPYLLQARGSIVGISSISGVTPLPGRSGYSASKHALDGFFESLRLENLENRLHIMLVHPGYTASEIRKKALDKNGQPQEISPLDERKLMPAEKVAREVVYGIALKRRDIILTREGKVITWIYRRSPVVADKLIIRDKQFKPLSNPLKFWKM